MSACERWTSVIGLRNQQSILASAFTRRTVENFSKCEETFFQSNIFALMYRKKTKQICFHVSVQGPSFRKSTEKHRVAFAPVPTNLHCHRSSIDNRVTREVLSCGTASALPLRFQNGGLSRLASSLELDRAYHDFPFWSARQTLSGLKKVVGQLSHSVSKKSMFFPSISSIVESITELERYAGILVDEENRRLALGQKRLMLDGLQNQIDNVDAVVISLSTKVAVMDKMSSEQSMDETYEKSVRDATCLCLDALLALADSVMEAQLFSLGTNSCSVPHLYFHIQIRSDFVLSQAITIGATALLNSVYGGWPVEEGVVLMRRRIFFVLTHVWLFVGFFFSSYSSFTFFIKFLLTREAHELPLKILNETCIVLQGIGRGSQNCASFLLPITGWSGDGKNGITSERVDKA
ncbi:unnamed protein product [Heligmosomoides polygyrus]|uniref:t-SNARE coiled-coil homology domain-containing protein n=1 Tax=Heligmosomoides polygyrus TaxID=6339 RepID=A0A183F948_HELPZ|nr:unnamed protein product [Heligmosomoides polygyrus]